VGWGFFTKGLPNLLCHLLSPAPAPLEGEAQGHEPQSPQASQSAHQPGDTPNSASAAEAIRAAIIAHASAAGQAHVDSLTRDAQSLEQSIKTDPQGLQEHLNTVAKNGGAEHLYVDSDKLKAALDETRTRPETLATLAPALARHAAEVEAGRSVGGKQPIKTGDYLARLAKTPLGQSLAPHLQLAPDALSQEQTRAYFTHQHKPSPRPPNTP
jgi:hypothetical protein